MANQSSILAWRIPRDRGECGLQSWGRKESDNPECLSSAPHIHTYIAGSRNCAAENNTAL